MKFLPPLFFCFLLLACSPKNESNNSSNDNNHNNIITLSSDTKFPAIIEGIFELDVLEGNLGDDDFLYFFFGTVLTNKGNVLVSVNGSVLRKFSINSGDKVKATIDGLNYFGGNKMPPTYTIINIEPIH